MLPRSINFWSITKDRVHSILLEWSYVYKIPLYYSVGLSLVIGFGAGVLGYDSSKKAQTVQQNQIAVYAHLLAENIFKFDFHGTTTIADLLLAENFVHSVQVTSREAYTVYEKASATHLQENVTTEKHPLIRNADGEKEVIGELTVEVENVSIASTLYDVIRYALVVWVVVFCITASMLSHYVFRHVVDPIKHLSLAIEKTLETGSPAKTDFGEKTHFGRFATYFNHMQEELSLAQHKFSTHLAALLRQTERNNQNIGILENILGGIGSCVRYFSPNDEIRDYGLKSDQDFFAELPHSFFSTPERLIEWLERKHADGNSRFRHIQVLPIDDDRGLYKVNLELSIGKYHTIVAFDMSDGGYAYVLTDQSSAKEMERSLLRAQKLEAVGVLVSGISHDYNNYLAVITGNLEQALCTSGLNSIVANHINLALSASWRAAETTHAMLAYSRQDAEVKEIANIGSIVRNTLPIIESGMPPEVTISLSVEDELTAHVPTGLLKTAILNLVQNARDAISGPGEIKITVRPSIDQDFELSKLPRGAYLAIDVTDTGSGVPVEIADQIFDLFFTTKPVDAGTGLGLSLAYSMATKLGGSLIHVNPAQGGASFRIILPVASPSPQDGKVVPIERTRLFHRRVLLVEDEAQMRELLVEALANEDFDVVASESVEQAKKRLLDSTPFDLIVTDVRLKDGLGTELVSVTTVDTPIIFISGNAPAELNLDIRGVNFLRKPFRLRELIEMADEILNSKTLTR